MRLQKGVPVGGVDPDLARQIARACHDRWSSAEALAIRLDMPVEPLRPMLEQLTDAGYLERRDTGSGSGGPDEWNTTLAGGALTMASFLKPIGRARAEELLRGVVDRAVAYNADTTTPYVITRLVVFGSYLRDDVSHLGDLDLGVSYAERGPDSASPAVLLDYSRRSGRRFRTFLEALGWAQMEIPRMLRNRSGYINVHTEDVTRFTDDWRVVYTAEESTRT